MTNAQAIAKAAPHYLSYVEGNTPEQIVATLNRWVDDDGQTDEITDSVIPWTPFEYWDPSDLYDEIHALAAEFQKAAREAAFLPREINALGEAIERGDPQDIADKWLEIKPLASIHNDDTSARLIAAAPSMLAALKDALACLENLREVQQWDKEDGDHIDEAIDARDACHLAIVRATQP